MLVDIVEPLDFKMQNNKKTVFPWIIARIHHDHAKPEYASSVPLHYQTVHSFSVTFIKVILEARHWKYVRQYRRN